MFGMKTTELLLIFLLILLLFGASRLPQLGKSLGAGIRNFKRGLADGEEVEGEKAEKKSEA